MAASRFQPVIPAPRKPASCTWLPWAALPAERKNNPQLGLMTALGPCSNLNSSVPLIVNEVTTVASIWALAPFTGADYAHIGSSSSNYTNGFANAFATVNNLVDITAGAAFSVTPAGYGTVPQAEINTLADAVNTCAATAGGAPGTAAPAAPSSRHRTSAPRDWGFLANSPTSILQAVLEVAQYPSNLYSSPSSGAPLFNLVPPGQSAFQPGPHRGSERLEHRAQLHGRRIGRLLAGQSAILGHGHRRLGQCLDREHRISSVTELSNPGAPLSPFTTGRTLASAGGFKGGGLNHPHQIAIDQQGNAWTLNSDSSLSELTLTASLFPAAPSAAAAP